MPITSEVDLFQELWLTDEYAKHAVLAPQRHAHPLTGIERCGSHELDYCALRLLGGAWPLFKL